MIRATRRIGHSDPIRTVIVTETRQIDAEDIGIGDRGVGVEKDATKDAEKGLLTGKETSGSRGITNVMTKIATETDVTMQVALAHGTTMHPMTTSETVTGTIAMAMVRQTTVVVAEVMRTSVKRWCE